jgi:hypothetical protein
MPPHCDSLDGPVVKAAEQALAARDVSLVLPYVPRDGEDEIIRAFTSTLAAREEGDTARSIADRWFFETVVRVHRAGEGAAFTGLKPAGLGHGPVVPIAERAFERGNPDELATVLCDVVDKEVRRRFEEALDLTPSNGDVEARRRHVEAVLGLEVWSHKLYEAAVSTPHEHSHA